MTWIGQQRRHDPSPVCQRQTRHLPPPRPGTTTQRPFLGCITEPIQNKSRERVLQLLLQDHLWSTSRSNGLAQRNHSHRPNRMTCPRTVAASRRLLVCKLLTTAEVIIVRMWKMCGATTTICHWITMVRMMTLPSQIRRLALWQRMMMTTFRLLLLQSVQCAIRRPLLLSIESGG
jgi:hypothetical protein